MRIPQSVTKRVVLKAYLTTDHLSAATGKTIAVVISKNGAAFGNPSAGATNATEISNGWYYVDLSTTDTGTAGPLIVRGTSSGVDDVEPQPFEVVNAHNAGFDGVPGVAAGASGGLPLSVDASGRVDVLKINGTSQTARDIGASVLVGDKTGFSLSTAGILAIWHQLTSAIVTAATIGKLLVDNVDAAISSRSTYAGADTSGTTTLLSRLTSTRAGLLDNLDTAVSGVAGAVWAVGTRTLTGFGTLVADTATAVWGAVARTLTDKTGFALTSAYDPAKTAAQAGDAMTLTAGERTSTATAVWASASRTLTGFGTLAADAATAVWGAITRSLTDKAGFALTSAYDPAQTAAQAGDAMTLTAAYDAAKTAAAVSDIPTATENATELLDGAAGVETGWTLRQALRMMLSTLAGKVSGGGTTTIKFRDMADSKDRITATVDTSGNRSAITRDAT